MQKQSPDAFANEIQWLVSQIIHDFISHFTAISTGLDMPLHMATEIFPMLSQSRQQLNAYLNVMRFMFTQGESTDQNMGIKIVTAYGQSLGIAITGTVNENDKIMTGLTLWAMKHIHNKSQSLITLDKNSLHIQHSYVLTPNYDADVLLDNALCSSPKDSFSAYLSRLIHQKNLSVTIKSPGPKELHVTLHPRA
jgi:hypothetical protein